ncbi:CLUMA_CG006756, isoform A [Clunio marinus]|uniref:CLUMA_CG006756, isoform A n=1 Tax=Clunio marinus TaxID=568069 RepID=A0A1J1I0V3_9DIPT|nr:CLUMA_CG006756, isoform A [Clunio marinus]
MEKWNKSVAVVTGANAGNGFGIMKKLATAGITVVGFDLNVETIEKFKSENKNLKVYSRICDITKEAETEAAFNWVEKELGGVDIIVNNAGTARLVGLLEHEKPMSELSLLIDLNFTSLVRCSRLAFKSMQTRDSYGYIININSVRGHTVPDASTQFGVYPATKFAITAATETMRKELLEIKNKKVRVTSLSPGAVHTNIFEAAKFPKKTTENILNLPHLQPDDIGETVAYLLSVPYHISIHELTVRATGGE